MGIFISCLLRHTEIICQIISEQESCGWHGVNLQWFSFLLRESSCHSRPTQSSLLELNSYAPTFTAILTLLAYLSDLCKISLRLTEKRGRKKKNANQTVMQMEFAGRIPYLVNAILHNATAIDTHFVFNFGSNCLRGADSTVIQLSGNYCQFKCDHYKQTLKKYSTFLKLLAMIQGGQFHPFVVYKNCFYPRKQFNCQHPNLKPF